MFLPRGKFFQNHLFLVESFFFLFLLFWLWFCIWLSHRRFWDFLFQIVRNDVTEIIKCKKNKPYLISLSVIDIKKKIEKKNEQIHTRKTTTNEIGIRIRQNARTDWQIDNTHSPEFAFNENEMDVFWIIYKNEKR